MNIILASASPRRRELMKLITEVFEVRTSDVDEKALEEELLKGDALDVSEGLARFKAQSVYDVLSDEEKASTVVIGADTTVILGDKVLGKPENKEDAISMLTSLSGQKHNVVTGVAIVGPNGITSFSDVADVIFNPLDDYQKNLIKRYCDTDEPYDKAGAYGIQSGGALLVEGIKGDFFSVVGLPVARLARALSELKVIE